MGELCQIVYLSRAAVPFDEAALRGLCEEASRRNRGTGVTGLLLYDGDRFIQALEGPDAPVRAIMARIAADPRHHDLDFVIDRPIAAREFGDWSMDYQRARAGCCSREFLNTVKEDVRAVADPTLQATFIGFAVLGSGDKPAGYRCAAV